MGHLRPAIEIKTVRKFCLMGLNLASAIINQCVWIQAHSRIFSLKIGKFPWNRAGVHFKGRSNKNCPSKSRSGIWKPAFRTGICKAHCIETAPFWPHIVSWILRLCHDVLSYGAGIIYQRQKGLKTEMQWNSAYKRGVKWTGLAGSHTVQSR